MTKSNFTLPPDLEGFASYLDAQLPNVRELFHYALAMLMVEGAKAKVVETHTTDDGRQRLLIWTVAGDSISIAKPLLDDASLAQMMEIVRGVVAEDGEAEGET
jgi:hypothetical protein